MSLSATSRVISKGESKGKPAGAVIINGAAGFSTSSMNDPEFMLFTETGTAGHGSPISVIRQHATSQMYDPGMSSPSICRMVSPRRIQVYAKVQIHYGGVCRGILDRLWS